MYEVKRQTAPSETGRAMTGQTMRPRSRSSLSTRLAILLASFVALAVVGPFSPSAALAQAESPPIGATVRVANTDGQRLHLRAGPSTGDTIVARLPAGETLVVTGTAKLSGGARWLPVRTTAGQAGWVSATYVVVVASAAPTTTAPAAPAAPGASQIEAASAAAAQARAEARTPAQADENQPKGGPVQVEAKLKYPELDGRDQEITVWVTRNGAPVVGAIVTLETNDGDDDNRFRQLDPTDGEGRTRRTFDVRHEKGTVELQVEAVAPDGGEGRTIVSYFKR